MIQKYYYTFSTKYILEVQNHENKQLNVFFHSISLCMHQQDCVSDASIVIIQSPFTFNGIEWKKNSCTSTIITT